MKKTMMIGMLVASLVGCAAGPKRPTNVEFAGADFGTPLSVAQFNTLAQANLKEMLTDPNSLMYYPSLQVDKYWATDSAGTNHYGYLGCYDYNAKNRMGGYAGKKRQCLFVRNGMIRQIYTVSFINNGSEIYFIPALNTIQ